MQAILCPISDEWYALPLHTVREVVEAPPVTPVPASMPWIQGLANLRGEILPVIDAAVGMGLRPVGDISHLMIIETVVGTVGIAITGAPEFATLGEPTGSSNLYGTMGRFEVDDRVVTLIDLDRRIAPR